MGAVSALQAYQAWNKGLVHTPLKSTVGRMMAWMVLQWGGVMPN